MADMLDEKEQKAENKRIAREERRRQKEEDKNGMKMSNGSDGPGKPSRPKANKHAIPASQRNMPPMDLKKVAAILTCVALVLIVILLWKPISYYINEAGRDHTLDNYLVLPDVTGYKEEDGLIMLRESGFVNIKKNYIYDQYAQDGCIVKTNEHIRAQLMPDEEIIVYICDKSIINTENPNMQHGNGSSGQQMPNNAYFSLNNMTVIDMAVDNDVFYAMIRNDSSRAMKNIVYVVGYQDDSGYKVGENKYNMPSDLMVLPGEKFIISGDISKVTAAYLYVSGVSCEYIEVPSEQRK